MIARDPISLLDKCRKYNHLIGYISNSNFKFKFSNSKQTFVFNWPFFFLLQNVFLKLINIFVFFAFNLVDAFSGSIKTEKSSIFEISEKCQSF